MDHGRVAASPGGAGAGPAAMVTAGRPTGGGSSGTPPDPVRTRRARIARATSTGKRVGYGLFLIAIVAFVAGAVTDFRPALVTVVIVALLVGSLVLAPSIVFGYGVRAAEREDRGLPPTH